jgi:hypothetical protein
MTDTFSGAGQLRIPRCRAHPTGFRRGDERTLAGVTRSSARSGHTDTLPIPRRRPAKVDRPSTPVERRHSHHARRVRGTSARGTCNKLAADQMPSRLARRSGRHRMSARATAAPTRCARSAICWDASTATTSRRAARKCAASRPGPQPRSATRPRGRTSATDPELGDFDGYRRVASHEVVDDVVLGIRRRANIVCGHVTENAITTVGTLSRGRSRRLAVP